MLCTLHEKLIPKKEMKIVENNEPLQKTVKTINNNVVVVYDVEHQAWRSFTLKSIKKIIVHA